MNLKKILTVIVVTITYPLAFIWSVNHLFDSGVSYDLTSWFAVVIMTIMTYYIIATAKGKD